MTHAIAWGLGEAENAPTKPLGFKPFTRAAPDVQRADAVIFVLFHLCSFVYALKRVRQYNISVWCKFSNGRRAGALARRCIAHALARHAARTDNAHECKLVKCWCARRGEKNESASESVQGVVDRARVRDGAVEQSVENLCSEQRFSRQSAIVYFERRRRRCGVRRIEMGSHRADGGVFHSSPEDWLHHVLGIFQGTGEN